MGYPWRGGTEEQKRSKDGEETRLARRDQRGLEERRVSFWVQWACRDKEVQVDIAKSGIVPHSDSED